MVDWSATAAWIALAISITGTIAGPIITTILTNKHQLQLQYLELEEKQINEYIFHRRQCIENFISYIGQCLADPNRETIHQCGKNYFQVYAYAPESLWDNLDKLYSHILKDEWSNAQNMFSTITRPLSALLKEAPPKYPSK